LPRCRLRHWLVNLKQQIQIHLTNTWFEGLLAGYDALLEQGRTPVTRIS
jgi:hypothetical protein